MYVASKDLQVGDTIVGTSMVVASVAYSFDPTVPGEFSNQERYTVAFESGAEAVFPGSMKWNILDR